MQNMTEKLPPLITPAILNKTLNDTKFAQNYRLLEANFGSAALEDFNK